MWACRFACVGVGGVDMLWTYRFVSVSVYG